MFKNMYSLYVVVIVAAMIFLSARAMATNYMGTGQLCQKFTVAGPGTMVQCSEISPANQFLSEDSCRDHFEAYLVKNTPAVYAINPNPEITLQADDNKILLKQGTPTNAFTDFFGFVIYSCTLNKNETQ